MPYSLFRRSRVQPPPSDARASASPQHLPPEILSQILDQVVLSSTHAIARRTHHSAALVCISWNRTATLYLYHTLEPTSTKSTLLLLRTLRSNPSLALHTQFIFRPSLSYHYFPGPAWRTQIVHVDTMDRPGSGEPGRMSKNDYQSLMSLVDVLVKHCPRLSKIQAPWRLGPLGIELPASLFLHNHRMKETLKELTVGYKVMVGSALQELVLPNLETLILESICVPRWQSLIGETQSITPSMSFPKLKHFIVRRCVMSQVLLDTFVKSIRQPLKSMTVLESRFMQSNGTSRRIPWFDNCKCPEVYGSMEHLSLDCTDGFTGYDHPLAPLKSLIQLDVRLCGVYHTRQLFHLPPSIKTLYIHHVRGPIPDSPFDVIWALSALLNELPSKKCRVTKIHLAWTFKKQDLVLWGILSAFIIGKCKKNGVEFIVEPYYVSDPVSQEKSLALGNANSKKDGMDRWAREGGKSLRLTDSMLRKLGR